LVIPPIGLPDTPATNPSAGDYTPPTTLPVPSFPLPVVTGGTGTTGGTTTGGTTTPTGNIPWSDVIGGIGDILGAGAGYVMNQADKDYYQGLMDKMMGMYQPGTPEATLMEQKMNAQDAAAGRNSQYGIRAQNLAGMLAEQRGKIMTSPVFGQMAQASRGHYDQSLNGIFSALGSATTSGSSLNNLLGLGSSALGNLFSSATAPTR
jgi:hypothetical protein